MQWQDDQKRCAMTKIDKDCYPFYNFSVWSDQDMNVSLTPELEAFVHRKVKSGLYNSASEVIRESLRLLEQKDSARKSRDEEIRREVLRGVEQLRNGEFIQLNSEAELEEFFEDVKRRGMERLGAAKT